MRPTIDNVKESQCTGCMLCSYICPQNAIKKSYDNRFFLKPTIISEKCNGCGLCYKRCPAANECSTKEKDGVKTYAAMADSDTRLNSSSGGAFAVLAKYVLDNGGVVIGAAFDQDFKLIHTIVRTKEGLQALQKSKYVQSDISGIYAEIETLKKENKYIMFTGTPCQCAAVKRIFGDYENLLLVDILCMGVASPQCFEKYLNEEFEKKDIKSIDFRYKKDNKWDQNLNLKISLFDNEQVIPFKNSSYFLAFLKGITLRESCENCKYAGTMRMGDVTLGDFWGIADYDNSLDDGMGTSMVLANTEKGQVLIKKVENRFKKISEVPYEVACKRNCTLSHPNIVNSKAKKIWDNYSTMSLKQSLNELINEEADCAIINYWYTNDHGAILTAFALQKFLRENGYSSKLINFAAPDYDRNNGISIAFEQKYLDSTYERYDDDSVKKLNGKFKHYLVGSDQVFRAEWTPNSWFLDFVDLQANKVAVAASFGIDSLNIDKVRYRKIRYLLNRFNAISVREKSALSICRRCMVRKATWILDPVFWIDRSDYTEIATSISEENICFCYIRDISKQIKSQIEEYVVKRNLKIVFCDTDMPIEDFLGNVINCDTFITDSYHGLCFGIIYNKKMFCYFNEKRGNARFESLIEKIHLPQEIFVNDSQKLVELSEISYEEINGYLELEKKASTDWLKNKLATPDKISKSRIILTKLLSDRFNNKAFLYCKNILKKILGRLRSKK